MDETDTVRFGIASVRELEIEVSQAASLEGLVVKAVSDGTQLLWIRDVLGHLHGIVVDKVGFIEVESALKRDVGFGPET